MATVAQLAAPQGAARSSPGVRWAPLRWTSREITKAATAAQSAAPCTEREKTGGREKEAGGGGTETAVLYSAGGRKREEGSGSGRRGRDGRKKREEAGGGGTEVGAGGGGTETGTGVPDTGGLGSAKILDHRATGPFKLPRDVSNPFATSGIIK